MVNSDASNAKRLDSVYMCDFVSLSIPQCLRQQQFHANNPQRIDNHVESYGFRLLLALVHATVHCRRTFIAGDSSWKSWSDYFRIDWYVRFRQKKVFEQNRKSRSVSFLLFD